MNCFKKPTCEPCVVVKKPEPCLLEAPPERPAGLKTECPPGICLTGEHALAFSLFFKDLQRWAKESYRRCNFIDLTTEAKDTP